MLRGLFAAGRKVAPGAGRSVVSCVLYPCALLTACYRPHRILRLCMRPEDQVRCFTHRSIESAQCAYPFLRRLLLVIRLEVGPHTVSNNIGSYPWLPVGLFESDNGKRLVEEINTNFYRFNHIANNIPQYLKGKYPPRTLLDPPHKALVRAALDSHMFSPLLQYNESGIAGSLYIAALCMGNGARLPGPWRNSLQAFLLNHASLLEVQGLNPMAHQQLLKAFFYYPNDGTYWDFERPDWSFTSTSPNLVPEYEMTETAVSYRIKKASLPGGPAQMDPSTLPSMACI